MESFGYFGFSSVSTTIKKKRSSTTRRPRIYLQPFLDISLLSSTPLSRDQNTAFDTSSQEKELNLNQYSSRASFFNFCETERARKIIKNSDGSYEESNEACASGSFRGGRCSEGVLAPANWKNVNQVGVISDEPGNENKLKKFKLKVGGVTRTLHAQSVLDEASIGGSSCTKSQSLDISLSRRKLVLKAKVDDNCPPHVATGSILCGIPWKESSSNSYTSGKLETLIATIPEGSISARHDDKYEATRKSKRIPKRRVLDGSFDDVDNDDEIRYLEKLKTSKASVKLEYENDEDGGMKKQGKGLSVSKKDMGGEYNASVVNYGSLSEKDGRRLRLVKTFDDTVYLEEDEPISEEELESKKKKYRKGLVDSSGDSKIEMSVTTRHQRSLQNGKDACSTFGANQVEFPNGLPPVPPRRQKDKLTEVQQQAKKAEAAQRRRLQSEKAARESEAEAIRKILGQDSNRKKREEKAKKRQDELAQERTANAIRPPSNAVRWTMGPSGTVVTFPDEMGLPSIFDPKPCSYPPPREKCAGPSCMNPYKYRDSKSKLPLCSLQCYKAIHGQMQTLTV